MTPFNHVNTFFLVVTTISAPCTHGTELVRALCASAPLVRVVEKLDRRGSRPVHTGVAGGLGYRSSATGLCVAAGLVKSATDSVGVVARVVMLGCVVVGRAGVFILGGPD